MTQNVKQASNAVLDFVKKNYVFGPEFAIATVPAG
jgi:hypothetical protein